MVIMSALRGCLFGLCLLLSSACGGGHNRVSDGGVSDGGVGDGGVGDGGGGNNSVGDGGVDGGGGSAPDAGSGLTITLSPSSLSIRQFEGQTKALRVEATIQGSVSGSVRVVIVDSSGVLRPDVKIQQTSSSVYQASFNTQSSLSIGQHQGTFEIHLCADASCQQQYTQTALPYDITVLDEDETNPTPLSPWTGVNDWTTFRGDAAHRGHVPVQLDPARFSPRWLWRDSNPVLSPTYTSLSAPISVSADGTAYIKSMQSDGIISSSVLYALDESDGSQRWLSNLGDTWASAPAVAAGQVYALTGDSSSGRIWSIQARTGSTTFQAPVPLTQGSPKSPSQPIIVGQKVYISYGGPSAETKVLDAASGTVLWSVASGGNGVAPIAVDDQRLYFFRPYWSRYTPGPGQGAGFTALDLSTGRTVFTIVKPPSLPTESDIRFRGDSPVLTGNGRALVNRNSDFRSSLECIDLESQTLAWEIEGMFYGVPTVVGDVFYIISGNQLEARSVADGHLLWSWSPSQGIRESFSSAYVVSDIVATNNLVFFSTDEQIYALDVEKRSVVWSYPAPGRLSISASGLLYIVRYARDLSSNFRPEGKVAAINLH
jgi:outer membrane protein assembly factor BamB